MSVCWCVGVLDATDAHAQGPGVLWGSYFVRAPTLLGCWPKGLEPNESLPVSWDTPRSSSFGAAPRFWRSVGRRSAKSRLPEVLPGVKLRAVAARGGMAASHERG